MASAICSPFRLKTTKLNSRPARMASRAKKRHDRPHVHPASWNGHAFDLQTDGSARQGSSGFYHSFFKGLIVLFRPILYHFIILRLFPDNTRLISFQSFFEIGRAASSSRDFPLDHDPAGNPPSP
jgi:hypothetical protein